jgi:O-acetyl-ADP-ribose deacetylase (regulator of RNase III)
MTDRSTALGDITTFVVGAIVNAANTSLTGGGGVDGAIHAAGGPSILEECRAWVAEHGPLPTGAAMITTSGDLPSEHVIHTVGPVFADHTPETAARLLSTCYRNCLDIAARRSISSIAFPNISTGVYGYPKAAAAVIAVTAVEKWIGANGYLDEVVFVCFDEVNHRLYSELVDS